MSIESTFYMGLYMFKRELSNEIKYLSKKYPIITLTGPRQSGKTTLAKALFPKKHYVTLEDPDQKLFAIEDPRAFLAQFQEDGAILDEVQNVPELLSYLQGIVDEQDKEGAYVLTGSHQLQLHQTVSQSLAGRTGIVHLFPLSLRELQATQKSITIDQALFYGGYPRIFNNEISPSIFHRDYVKTYVERDVRQMIQVRDLTQFQRFLSLCASRIGRLFDATSISNELGIARSTVMAWQSILEASYLIFRLPPYFENFGKRIIKTPKLYFTDVGLACYLLGIENETQLQHHPLRGELFENLIIMELVKTRLNQGLEPRLYFFRDSGGNEVDVVFQQASQLIPIEIKSSKTFQRSFLKGLRYFKNLVGERCQKGALIYTGNIELSMDDDAFSTVNFLNTHQII